VSLEAEQLKAALGNLANLVDESSSLCKSLGDVDLAPPDASLPLAGRTKAARVKLDELQALKAERLQAVSQLVAKFNKLEVQKSAVSGTAAASLAPDAYLTAGAKDTLAAMVVSAEEELAALTAAEAELAQANEKLMADLRVEATDATLVSPSAKATNEKLKALRQERVDELRTLGATIGGLWNDLEVPNEAREEFKARVTKTGLTPDSKKVGEAEVLKLKQLKAASRKAGLATTREDIQKHWDLCGYTEDQRKQQFPDYDLTDDDDTLPGKLVNILTKLTQEYEDKRPVIFLKEKYDALAACRQELFDLENAQTSTLGERRNSITQTTEIARLTALVKELPAVLVSLVTMVKTIEATPVALPDGRKVRRPFMFGGERYLVAVDRMEKEFRARKGEAKKMREERKMQKRVGTGGGATPGKLGLKSAATLVMAAGRAKAGVAAAAGRATARPGVGVKPGGSAAASPAAPRATAAAAKASPAAATRSPPVPGATRSPAAGATRSPAARPGQSALKASAGEGGGSAAKPRSPPRPPTAAAAAASPKASPAAAMAAAKIVGIVRAPSGAVVTPGAGRGATRRRSSPIRPPAGPGLVPPPKKE
jgi:hypothetical protein